MKEYRDLNPQMLALLVGFSLAFGGAALAIEAGDAVPKFDLRTLDDEVRQMGDYAGKTVVLEWTHYGCPFVGKLYKSGKLLDLQRKAADRGVVWLVVASGASADSKKLKMHEFAKLRKVDEVLLDRDGTMAKAYGVRTAPHFFVITPEGKVAFEGALDDNRSPSLEKAAEGRNFLAEAIEAVQAGKTPAVLAAKPYGCAVKYVEN